MCSARDIRIDINIPKNRASCTVSSLPLARQLDESIAFVASGSDPTDG